jgi:ectoine hydroxylase-related dioxygenase (phytanoyl-CoA dioxygenase family)
MDSTIAKKAEQALTSLGVTDRTLTAQQRRALDEQGYLVVTGVVGEADLGRLRAAFDRACDAEGIPPNGTRHPKGLLDLDPGFVRFLMHPVVLAATWHVLGRPFRAGMVAGRDPLPGFGQQALHPDGLDPGPSAPFQLVTTLGLIDDYTEDNGATRLVPGSHRARRGPPKSFALPSSRHPDQIVVTAPAGSVLVFNGHLWHGGTGNRSGDHRRIVQSSFAGWEQFRRMQDQLQQLGVEPDERFATSGSPDLDVAPEVRFLLGRDPE